MNNASMSESEYLRLREQLEKDFRQGVEALNRKWRLANHTAPPQVKSLQAGLKPSGNIRITISAAVRNMVEQQQNNYSVRDICDAVREQYRLQPAPKSVRHVLDELCEKDVIEIVDQGGHGTPTIYSPLRQRTKPILE